ncbi:MULTISPECIES: HNH endonuclease domain-containing protein [Cyanophyceae]|uniref:HNH endonuclease domain-containing protein n=1 Tax=Cyanophyceae TaxID=3028117 RepID=UPI00233059C8|nr:MULTISPECIES: HNH endonuclease domain-containing protein [Cyanophyceae]MDB9354940.1 HNH endonuclease domain-containing protein [Nodularia spumigena CS-587/03]MDB9338750.1 HNH endonuclease domain-containing protein [Nodularia spumigena CS-589/07]MDB9399600.1 HNH endonuclease domain-containing protein [Microcystis aeruginosa CS-567/02-A1]MDB9499225.1 HNH endonuclease domain-containing protein [Nodularia spumigena CS-336/02]MDB9531034.1 HNH endonuclease domain-containing protein [Nodularia spu
MYDLPNADNLNISALAGLFDSTTNSYKYLYFLSLLDIIKRSNFDNLSSISFRTIIVEMLANAWYPHKYFKLFFGIQDQITNKLDALELEITEPILKFRDTDKKLLRTTVNNQNIDDIVNYIGRYVPYRLIRPFFTQDTRGLKDYDVNQAIINLSNNQFDTQKPLYCFKAENNKDCNAIVLHPEWIQYLKENYIIVRGWASWEWLNYMQQRNPSIPNVVNKLYMPQQRDSLANQTKYWKIILEHQDIECIYSQVKLDKNEISLDHYLPWSFVAHDQLWNLIPTTKSVNSSKSNNLPSQKYFSDFVELQYVGLNISYENISKNQWLKYTEPFVSELKVSQADDLLNLEILKNAYERTIQPLSSLATIQGFSANWVYR